MDFWRQITSLFLARRVKKTCFPRKVVVKLETQEALSYSRKRIEDHHQGNVHMCSCSLGLAARLVVEEHHVANADVEEVLRLYLPATANDQIGRLLQREPKATQGLWIPLLSMSKIRRERFYCKQHQRRWVVELFSECIDVCQSSLEIARNYRLDDCTGHEHVPKNKALGRVGSNICTDRTQFEKRHRGKKKGLDSPSGGRARRRRCDHHTLAARS